jgi:hypothetical protein
MISVKPWAQWLLAIVAGLVVWVISGLIAVFLMYGD